MAGQVVLDLLSVIDDIEHHQVFFDNVFSSYKLFSVLSSKKIYATATIRENRTSRCPLESAKSIGKKERGSYDSAFDESTGIALVRWNDNSVVTTISNQFTALPIGTAKRYDRKQKKEMNINQPNVIKFYNKHMGGVDLHDNGVANYRIGISGKKWWWPLFINYIHSVIVNCWKLYNTVNVKKIPQLDFKSFIAVRLLKYDRVVCKPSAFRCLDDIRFDNIGHIIIKSDNKVRRHCKVCHNHTIFSCNKCNVHIHTQCFKQYHLNKK